MAYGLQIFKSSGALAIDISDTLSRFVAVYSGTINSSNDIYNYVLTRTSSISVPGMTTDGTWGISVEYNCTMTTDEGYSGEFYLGNYMLQYQLAYWTPQFTIGNNVINISWLACTGADSPAGNHGGRVWMTMNYKLLVFRL